MTAREYLVQLAHLKRKIGILEMEREDIFQTLLPKGVSYDKEAVQVSHGGSMLDNIMPKLIDYDKRLNNMREAYINQRDMIVEQLMKLYGKDFRLTELLYERYVLEWTWQDIADDLKFESVYVRKELHAKALEFFADAYGLEKTPKNPA